MLLLLTTSKHLLSLCLLFGEQGYGGPAHCVGTLYLFEKIGLLLSLLSFLFLFIYFLQNNLLEYFNDHLSQCRTGSLTHANILTSETTLYDLKSILISFFLNFLFFYAICLIDGRSRRYLAV